MQNTINNENIMDSSNISIDASNIEIITENSYNEIITESSYNDIITESSNNENNDLDNNTESDPIIENNILDPKIKLTAPINEIINYLNKLWHGPSLDNHSRIYNIFSYFVNVYYNFWNPYKLPDIKKNLEELKKISYMYYNDCKINNEQPIENDNLTNDFEIVNEFINGNNLTRKNILKRIDIKGKKICYCTIFYKYKPGQKILENYPVNNPDNFRYFINHHNTIKILDNIWYINVIEKSTGNLPNSDIFINKLIKNNNTNTIGLIDYANNNTLSIDNVLLLDLIKAYDSIEWYILEDLLLSSLKRKMDIMCATELFDQYKTIMTNRVITYMGKIIKVSKSIPTGLSSSMLVFTYIIDEIITRWLIENIYNFQINIDFIINIYIDDIYIKILNLSKTNIIINTFIKILTKYKLNISFNKSRISKNLSYNTFKFIELSSTDLYLGIPFTRNISSYMEIILNLCNTKHNLSYEWIDIYNILISNKHKHKSLLISYMKYKLKPILLNNIYITTNINHFLKLFLNL